MMGRDPERTTYWQWQAMLWNWNDRHTTDKAGELPDADAVARAMATEALRR